MVQKWYEKKSINALCRSFILPGWGQFYNKQPVKGTIIVCSEIVLISGAVATYYMSEAYYDIYNTNPKGEPEKYYQLANHCHYISDYLTLCTVVVWVYSMIDAYIIGKKNEQKKI